VIGQWVVSQDEGRLEPVHCYPGCPVAEFQLELLVPALGQHKGLRRAAVAGGGALLFEGTHD